MSEKAIQMDRVLAAMVKAGGRGVTQVDFELPDVIDGGKPILRVAARIYDLKHERGAVIRTTGRRQKCSVYVLESVRPGTAVTGVPEQGDAGPLVAGDAAVPEPMPLPVQGAGKRCAIFDADWEDAA